MVLCTLLLAGWTCRAGYCADDILILRSLEGSKFEYNGKIHEVKHPDVRSNKVVFYTNLYTDAPLCFFTASEGKQIPLNFKILVADLSDGKLQNVRRLTRSEGVHEVDPLWVGNDLVIYIEKGGDTSGGAVYRNIHIDSTETGEAIKDDYIKIKKRLDFKLRGPALIKAIKLPIKQGGSKCAFSLRFSPDGKYFAAAVNNVPTLWDANSFDPVIELKDCFCANIVFSPDGSKFFTGGGIFDAKIYSSGDFSLLKMFNKKISFLRFSPDGKYIATSGPGANPIMLNTAIKVLDSATYKEISSKIITGGPELVVGVDIDFSRDGKYLAAKYGSPFWDTIVPPSLSIKLFDPLSLNLVGKISALPTWFIFSPDRKHLLTGEYNSKKIHLWDMMTLREIKVIDNFWGCSVYTNNGKYLVSIATYTAAPLLVDTSKPYTPGNYMLRVFDSQTFAVIYSTNLVYEGYIDSIAISHDDKYLVCGGWGNTIDVYDISPITEGHNEAREY